MRLPIFAALLGSFFAFHSLADDGATITVTVTNIPGAKGELLIGLYNSADTFTVTPLEESPKVPLTSTDPVTVKFIGVEPGTYAIAVIQDLNQNGELDKNFIGIPKEPLAFSIITEIPRGKPDFEACSFEVAAEDLEMEISLTSK